MWIEKPNKCNICDYSFAKIKFCKITLICSQIILKWEQVFDRKLASKSFKYPLPQECLGWVLFGWKPQ